MPTVKTITANEVATHNSASSCWTIIDTQVYDITSYINKHPGGREEIMRGCGTNGTAIFDRVPAHQRAQNIQQLASFAIGYVE
jgi:cytochrome b involved in lipid metabolism